MNQYTTRSSWQHAVHVCINFTNKERASKFMHTWTAYFKEPVVRLGSMPLHDTHLYVNVPCTSQNLQVLSAFGVFGAVQNSGNSMPLKMHDLRSFLVEKQISATCRKCWTCSLCITLNASTTWGLCLPNIAENIYLHIRCKLGWTRTPSNFLDQGSLRSSIASTHNSLESREHHTPSY